MTLIGDLALAGPSGSSARADANGQTRCRLLGSGKSLSHPRRVLPPVDERQNLNDLQLLMHAVPQLIREHP